MFRRSENGASDSGILMMLLGLCIIISLGIGILGWIKSVKDARVSKPIESSRPSDSPYEEPGGFQITF
ncbi:MAG: hypothetical protein GYA55_08655 [SAR324 cluster bacterium]|uniref:Uncharacterized protein n=1 Tax=SAR324 cluster bacterium TaxID=2024889 RepID=A0A7X9FSB9_9DELT|nr:hypothetical protein [SAR324 cluster bacterium]